MASSSPSPLYPSTPACPRYPLQYKPLNSSPLVASPSGSPKMSSPVVAAQARRRSQYKPATVAAHPARDASAARRLFSNSSSAPEPAEAADPQKAFLRSRFKARCFERAAKARARAVSGKRAGKMREPSSDDYPMEDDEEEEDEDIMQDELFRRIMANATRKQTHSYRVSYAQEVGSSYDPDMEDASRWEEELTMGTASTASQSAPPSHSHPHFRSQPPRATPGNPYPFIHDDDLDLEPALEPPIPDDALLLDLTPGALDDEELEAYAEECARRAALADFEDIPVEELFDRWSEDEEEVGVVGAGEGEDEMDMS